MTEPTSGPTLGTTETTLAAVLDPEPDGYTAAIDELEAILREIEDDDVDVDVLAERVARAAALIDWCRDRILTARAAVDQATEGLDDAD